MSIAGFGDVLDASRSDNFDQFSRARAHYDRSGVEDEVIREIYRVQDYLGTTRFSKMSAAQMCAVGSHTLIAHASSPRSAYWKFLEASQVPEEKTAAVEQVREAEYVSLARTEKSVWLGLVIAAILAGALATASVLTPGFIDPAVAFLAIGVVITLSMTTFFARRELRKPE